MNLNISNTRRTRMEMNSPVYSVAVASISKRDVLFGKGRRAHNHHGNIYYRSIVKELQPKYSNTSKRAMKHLVAIEIWNRVPGRFLARLEDDKYCPLTRNEAVKRIKQALRDRKRPSPNKIKVCSYVDEDRPKHTEVCSYEYDEEDMQRVLELCMKL